jgi:glycosyltransferase 2 family protein
MIARSPRMLNAALMLALMIAVLTLVDVKAVFSAVHEIRPELLVLTLLLLSADRVAMGLKWRHLIRGAGANIRASTTIAAYYQSGFAALLLPTSLAGEVIRGVLGRRAGVPGQVVVASMVAEKLVAAVSNLTLAGAAATFIWFAGSDQEMGVVARLAAIPVLVVIVVLAVAASRRVHGQTGRFLGRWAPVRVCRTFDQLSAKVVAYRTRPGLLCANLLFNLGEHLVQFCVLYVLAVGLGISLELAMFLAVTAIVMLVKRTAGFLESWGLAEGAVILLYSLFGVPRELSVALALALWATSIIAALPGALLLYRSGSALGGRTKAQLDAPLALTGAPVVPGPIST